MDRSAIAMTGAPSMTEITLQLRSGAAGSAGNGYAQGYGWFNVAYSLGTLGGPLLAGWLHENWGWTCVCFTFGTAAGLTIIPILLFTDGELRE